MIPKSEPPAPQSRLKKRKAYWSVMLVGEHGRVIPFKYFKETAAVVLGLLILMTVAVAVLTYGYVRQSRVTERLQAEMAEVREQAAKLRDEKDLLLAQLVIRQQTVAPEPSVEPASAAKAPSVSKPDKTLPEIPEQAAVSAASSDIPKDAAPAPVKMSGRISHFGVAYDHERPKLTVRFRINNTTPGRKPLSGSIAVVLSNSQDAGAKRIPLPATAVPEGAVSPKKGQPFSVNNYRTIEFDLPDPPSPGAFNTAEIFVLSPEGKEIVKQNFTFAIEPKAPPPKPAEKTGDSVNATTPQVDTPAEAPESESAGPLERPSPQETVSPQSPAEELPRQPTDPSGSASDDVREKF